MSQTLQSPRMQALLQAQTDRMQPPATGTLPKVLVLVGALGAMWWALS